MPHKRTAPKSDPNAAEPSRSSKRLSKKAIAEEEFVSKISEAEDEALEINEEPVELPAAIRVRRPQRSENEERSVFVGEPVDVAQAKRRWPHRYLEKQIESQEAETSIRKVEKTQARRHYTEARIDGRIPFTIGEDAFVKADDGEDDYICRIIEMFEGVDGEPYFTAQWFYRAKDTVIKHCSNLIDDKRVFLSTIKDDNNLDCLVRKIKIVQLPLNVDPYTKTATLAHCDYYYDMLYHVPFSTFLNSYHDVTEEENQSDSTISSESVVPQDEGLMNPKEMKLLDLFSGCGAMSTGLCLGANLSGVKLVTKWAVDLNKFACQSLKHNHPETEVRNEKAEEFLALLKEWERLCSLFSLIGDTGPQQISFPETENNDETDDAEAKVDNQEIFEVEEILSICYGLPEGQKDVGLYFKIRWKGYGEDEDTWEPEDGLSDAHDKLKEFVTNGFNSKILPLPGDADVICGGPPCQGISGFNRFRDSENPLKGPKNEQLLVYMKIVEYLKPKFVLMENVVDIVKFSKGFLGRYALGSLVGMNYQARLGMMVAGAYGLPQFRMRVFLWGAHHTMKLPQFPLPTHNVVVRGHSPLEFESNAVTYDDGCFPVLKDKLFLGDAISDLPAVENDESHDEMPYGSEPKTEFQKFIRLTKEEMLGSAPDPSQSHHLLFDHRPLELNIEDYQRVCNIPVKKGANFRDLKGVKVRSDNKVELDPKIERVFFPSGKPLVPDYAMSFMGGSSSKPFGRLWWDETVPTVVTRAEPHNQIILHPEQNRVLTVRENARLQGFPDYYKLFGPIKERYIQVGNAVAIPVARALGYSLGLSVKHDSSPKEHLVALPTWFPRCPSPAVEA
ncbi:Chromomethylase [Heracleum sosnowskyi]|uniref:DNA (cytosine-5-)-methyltransferase n=1 Tax=Heracleum sosnowskyi TaxID=360622 RepID=A0AAD8MR62_9APIA|nr:Chromomethylase [Heracleum sosnowskyi]